MADAALAIFHETRVNFSGDPNAASGLAEELRHAGDVFDAIGPRVVAIEMGGAAVNRGADVDGAVPRGVKSAEHSIVPVAAGEFAGVDQCVFGLRLSRERGSEEQGSDGDARHESAS